MSTEDIITSYACHSQIEAMFCEIKQQLGSSCYHFWTRAVPRLDHYRRKDSHDWQRIVDTLKATESYMMFSSIAMGIIQTLCLKYQDDIRVSDFRYLRTSSCDVMSESSMMEYLRQNLYRFMARQGGLTITKIISDK